MKSSLAKRMAFATIMLMDLLTGIEFDIFVPSFPELQAQFALSPFWVEALLSVNFIGYCLSLFFVGGLADRFGRKPIILSGLSIFVFGSILCLAAPYFELLLLGRFLQGIGIAAPAILSFLIVADSYPIEKQQSLLGILNAVMNTAAGIAPVVGSYVTLHFHWHGNFTIMLLVGVLVLVMSMLFIPNYSLPVQKEDSSPSAYLTIFKSKSLMLLLTHITFIFVPYWIFVGMSPILYMKNLGVSLSRFGYYQGTLALVFALGSLIFAFMVSKVNPKKMLILSSFIYFVSFCTLSLASFTDCSNPLLITLAFLPFCIGTIIPTIILYPLCLNYMPQAKGRVSAVIQGARLIISALCLQVAGYFYRGSFQNIGYILIVLVAAVLITFFMVMKNRELNKLIGGS